MIDKGIVLLQNCLNLQKEMQGSCSETYPASHDANQITRIKVEDVSDTEEEENPVPLKYSGIKTEHVVSCMSVSLLSRFHRCPELPVVFLTSISLSVHMRPLYYAEWIMKSPLLNVEWFYFVGHHFVKSTSILSSCSVHKFHLSGKLELMKYGKCLPPFILESLGL
jgi:hypothetical protein